MRQIFRFFALLSILHTPYAPLHSQTLVYPVRSGHQWGYVSARGRVVIPPQYEAFSETNLPWNIHPEPSAAGLSPFRLVERNSRVGLIDRTLHEVLPCSYKRIRPISQHFFAVETDSQFVVVNRRAEVVMAEPFDDICATDTFSTRHSEWFFVKKNGLWGVYHLKKGLVIAAQYDDIASAYSTQFFRVRPAGYRLWGLINDQNQVILPPEFSDIRAVSKDFIAVLQEGQRWRAMDARGNALFDPKWVRLDILNRHFAWMQDEDKRSALWNISKREWVPTEGLASAFFPMDEDFIIPYLFGLRGLMDSTGNMLIPPKSYDSITVCGLPGYYRVRTTARYWGILKPGNPPVTILPCRFTSLTPFSDSLAIVCGDLGCGVVNGRMQEVLAPLFSRIEREGDTLSVYDKKDGLSRYKVQRGGQLELLESYDDVLQIRIGTDQNYVEARPVQSRGGNRSGSFDGFTPGFYSLTSRDTVLRWESDFTEWKLLRRRPGQPAERLYPTLRFAKAEPVTARDLTAVYRADLVSRGRLARLFGRETGVLSRIALFRLATGKFVTQPDFLGIRTNDFRYNCPYAVFIDTLGRMGLLDRDGVVRTRPDGSPLRFTYIGDFSQGKARVCVGGVLRPLERDEDWPLVETMQQLAARYQLLEPDVAPYEQPGAKWLVVAATEKSRPSWGYIDTTGALVMEPQYDFAQTFDADTMAIVQKNGLSGLINRTCELAVPCRYLRILPEGRGVYKVSVKNPYLFYYNQQGHQYCPPRYDRYAGFSGGLCPVRRDSLWGFLDSTGRERIACRYEQVRAFSGGLAAVLSGGAWAFVDTSGTEIFSTSVSKSNTGDLGNFVEGLCRFRRDKKWGYLDPKGKEKIAPTYYYAGDFCQGVAPVRLSSKFGLIDTAGNYIEKPVRFAWISAFDANGLAQVRETAEGLVGLLNTRGQLIAPLKYISIDTFFGGCARARDAAGWGLLNVQGKELIPCGLYAGLGRVSEGILTAMPRSGSQWTYMDTLNRRIIHALFTTAAPFQGGYALVDEHKIVGRTGFQKLPMGVEPKFLAEGIFGMESGRGAFFANARGENLFGRYFEEVRAFQNGIGKVKKGNKWGAVNRRGIALVRPKFNFVHPQRDGNLIVRPPNLFGLVDKTGKVLVAAEYDSIEWMEGNVFKLELGEQVGYLRRSGKWMWEMKN